MSGDRFRDSATGLLRHLQGSIATAGEVSSVWATSPTGPEFPAAFEGPFSLIHPCILLQDIPDAPSV
jgi:hypothetical protein